MAKFALVTGGAKRIGAVISRHLASVGYHLFIHCFSSYDTAERLQKELANDYPEQSFKIIQQDLAQSSFGNFEKVLGDSPLNLLVHNASLFYPTPLESLTLEDWETMNAVNTRTPLFLTKKLLPHLRQTENPAVIFIGDIHGEVSFPLKNYSAYGASKAALLYLVRLLAIELAPKIRVNAVCPGITMWPEDVTEGKKKNLEQMIPLQKINDPKQIAEAVSFLAQQTSITGVALPVDGGRLIARSDNRGELS